MRDDCGWRSEMSFNHVESLMVCGDEQGVVTPIGAVVTAATGVKKFLTTLRAIRTRKTLIS